MIILHDRHMMHLPCLLPEVSGLSRSEGGGGVCVPIIRENFSGDIIFYKIQRPIINEEERSKYNIVL